MAKTSSSKKVARVARSSGSKRRRVRERPKMGFSLAIFVILVLGTLMVVFARNERVNTAAAAEAPSSAKNDHWHVAYGFYVCDHFLPPFSDAGEDKNGIHTHGDGIIHTHPFNAASSGSKAKLKIFADQVGMKLGKDSITTPDGTTYDSNYKCGDKPAKIYVYRWDKALDPQATAEVFTDNFGEIRLRDDRSAITFAVVPEGTDPNSIPRPDSINTLNNLSDVSGQASAGGAGSPTASVPNVSIPGQTPGASTPVESTPAVSTPAVSTPAVSTPAVSTPAVSTPAVSTPVSSTP